MHLRLSILSSLLLLANPAEASGVDYIKTPQEEIPLFTAYEMLQDVRAQQNTVTPKLDTAGKSCFGSWNSYKAGYDAHVNDLEKKAKEAATQIDQITRELNQPVTAERLAAVNINSGALTALEGEKNLKAKILSKGIMQMSEQASAIQQIKEQAKKTLLEKPARQLANRSTIESMKWAVSCPSLQRYENAVKEALTGELPSGSSKGKESGFSLALRAVRGANASMLNNLLALRGQIPAPAVPKK